jgi:predicted HD phosphohydrolase
MRKPKYKELEALFHFWCGKLGFKEPLIIKRDNRLDSVMCVEKKEKKIICSYHSRRVGQKPKCALLSDLFHELGHIKNDLSYNTEKEVIESEKKAELFSIKMMKKHYPSEYKILLERMERMQSMKYWKKKDPIYYEAWKNIKDYKETIL